MNHMSVYLKNKVINDNLRATPVYVALFNESDEISQPSYARQAISFVEPENGQTTNREDILFPVAEENWGEITHVGIFDDETNGNLLFRSPAEVTQNINESSQYRIPKNYLIVRLR